MICFLRVESELCSLQLQLVASSVHIHLVVTLAVDVASQHHGGAGQPLCGVPGDAALAGRLPARPAPLPAGG